MITCSARLEVTDEQETVLRDLTREYHRACERTYQAVIQEKKEWFVKSEPTLSYRNTLLDEGYSQREASSIRNHVKGQHDAHVENTKAYYQRVLQQREACEKHLLELQTAVRQDGKKIHQKASRLQLLNSKIHCLRVELQSPCLRFTSQQSQLVLHHPTDYGYADYNEAREYYQRKRDIQLYVEGDKEAKQGNYSLKINLVPEESRNGILTIIINGETLIIPCKGFTVKGGRYALLAAQSKVHNGKRQFCSVPVSVRVIWNEKKSCWYVHATVERSPQLLHAAEQLRQADSSASYTAIPFTARPVLNVEDYDYLLGVDLNADHIAYCLEPIVKTS